MNDGCAFRGAYYSTLNVCDPFNANFKFRNRSTCSKGPMKRAGKDCGDSPDLKSPGGSIVSYFVLMIKGNS